MTTDSPGTAVTLGVGMFGSGQRSTARHRATADPARFDGPTAAGPEALEASPGRTPIWATLTVFALLVAVLLAVWVLFGRGSSPTGPTAGTPTGSPSTSPSARAAAGPGISTVVRVRPDGSQRTTERITFQQPRTSLVVLVPARPGAGAQFHPSVTNISIRAHGHVQRRNDTLSTGEATSFQLSSPATRVVVRYSADNAGAAGDASSPGRALALVTPVLVAPPAGVKARVEVISPHVLNIGCVTPRGVLATCGTRIPGGWQVHVRAGRPVPDVIAQVSLKS